MKARGDTHVARRCQKGDWSGEKIWEKFKDTKQGKNFKEKV